MMRTILAVVVSLAVFAAGNVQAQSAPPAQNPVNPYPCEVMIVYHPEKPGAPAINFRTYSKECNGEELQKVKLALNGALHALLLQQGGAPVDKPRPKEGPFPAEQR